MKKLLTIVLSISMLVCLGSNSVYAEEINEIDNESIISEISEIEEGFSDLNPITRAIYKGRWIKGNRQIQETHRVLVSSNNEKEITKRINETTTVKLSASASVIASLEANGGFVTSAVEVEATVAGEEEVVIAYYYEERYIEKSDWYKVCTTTYVEALFVGPDGVVHDRNEKGYVVSESCGSSIEKVITGTTRIN